MITESASELAAKLVEEREEKDSLFDSMENLSKPLNSRNPSIDSSIRMSSTCSCSIKGGDSFDSWTSAKSSLTNSSSTPHSNNHCAGTGNKSSGIPAPTAVPSFNGSLGACSIRGRKGVRLLGHHQHMSVGSAATFGGSSSKSSSAAGEDTEDSTALTYHRYYHVFKEGELDKLIEKYVQNLHIISSFYDHANWCIIAEKVQVWTI